MRGTRVVRRSAWRETPAVGGPAGQGDFLNGAVLTATELTPGELLEELIAIESRLGRVRERRWEARTVDLDVLLYDRIEFSSAELTIPHPRMHYRRFVLEGGAEVAPWMVHPECGWTVSQLLAQLDRGEDLIAVASDNPKIEQALTAELRSWLKKAGAEHLNVRKWSAAGAAARPKLILATVGAAADAGGGGCGGRRKILCLPAAGPIAWLFTNEREAMLAEALAVIGSAWPKLAAQGND
jgi:2-amino-4-hydroxy-6-hydroxymethyldihydropteridine diphosphokinase